MKRKNRITNYKALIKLPILLSFLNQYEKFMLENGEIEIVIFTMGIRKMVTTKFGHLLLGFEVH